MELAYRAIQLGNLPSLRPRARGRVFLANINRGLYIPPARALMANYNRDFNLTSAPSTRWRVAACPKWDT